MSKRTVHIDYSVGSQPYLRITESVIPTSAQFSYRVEVEDPTGAPLLPPIDIQSPLGPKSIAYATSQAMAKLECLNYGYNQQPYLWNGTFWMNADDWMKALSHSMHGLIGTGEMRGRQARSFYTLMYAAWAAQRRRPMELQAFGKTDGFPITDGVMLFKRSGQLDFREHRPSDENLHVLQVEGMQVMDEYLAMQEGLRHDSLLFRFLRSSLNEDQIVTLRRWFGLHLIAHQVGNPDKMLYMWGPGGNGKGVVVGLLQALLTEDAVAWLRLKDLLIPSALELLIGKLAMIGAEGTPETDNELLKTIVSWEGITVNPKYRDPFLLRPTCLVTQASNPPPHFDDDSDAMVRRVIVLHMTHQPSGAERIPALAQKIAQQEYALLVAFALHGAEEIAKAGTFEVPKSVEDFSRTVVRPIRPIDRFFEYLEFGDFEVAGRQGRRCFWLMCRKHRLPCLQPADFFQEFVTRLERANRRYLRRSKVTNYTPQQHINDKGEQVLLVPQIKALKDVKIFFGLRVVAGPFGPAIGQPISADRRGLPSFAAPEQPI